MARSILVVLMFALIFFAPNGPEQQEGNKASPYLIRADRPSVYIEFERSGKESPLFEGESESRIWLRLHNNTRWSIAFCSFPVDANYGGIGVVHEVMKNSDSGMDSIYKGGSAPPAHGQAAKVPQGYSTADTCSPSNVYSGSSITFSVPRVHLGKDL
jgi:hypothetical protein